MAYLLTEIASIYLKAKRYNIASFKAEEAISFSPALHA